MKSSFKYILSSLVLTGSLVACSPDDFEGVYEEGVPQASTFESLIDIDVDQEFNQVIFSIKEAKGIYPIWTIECPDGKTIEHSTVNGYQKIYVNSGDYRVTCKIGNRNGISDGSITKEFHLNNSLVDFSSYVGRISKAAWHFANKEKGHLACGPNASDPVSWWSASEDEKKDFGLYDNELTFADDYSYTFDPGDAKSIYVNWGVTANGWQDAYWSGKENDDFNVPVEDIQESVYGFETRGNDVYLTFPKGTYFPYIAYNDLWNEPAYKLVNLTPKKMTLVADNGGIAWQYILTTENTVTKEFKGFTYDQPDNIWKNIEVQAGGIYYADGGWSPYPDNGGATFNVTNQETNVVLPLATVSQWQAQFPIHTNVGPGSEYMTSAKHYDFSCIITSNKDLNGMTLKLVETGENGVPGSLGIAYDANAVFYNNETNLKAYEDYVFYLVDQPGVDIQDNLLQLVLDFGGCEEGTEVTIKDIVLIDHALNKELDKLPSDQPGEEPVVGGVDWSGANLLADMPVEITQWYAPGWNQIADAEYTAENGVYTITYPEAASDQWMAQFTFNNTGIALDPEKSYDFRIKVTSTTDHPGVTIKLTQQDDDDTFITADRHALVAFEETWIELSNLKFIVNGAGKGVINNLKMPFDFGGIEAGTVITLSDMHLQEHKEFAGGGSNNWNGENLLAGMAPELTQWYAPGWNQIADAEYTAENGVYNIIYPSATTDQWMAQFTLNNTGIALDPAKSYDLRLKMTSSTDHPGATVKFTQQDDDDTFITADRHALAAYEETWIELTDLKFIVNGPGKGVINNLKIVFDFGGNADNTEITISDMHLQEHIAGGNAGGAIDYNSAANLWKAVDAGDAFISVTPWFATDGWAQIGDPEWSHDGNVWELTLPDGMGGSQWQGQFPINTTLTAAQADKYTFSCTIESDMDLSGVTIKLTETDEDGAKHDDNFFRDDRHDVEAYEPYVYTITGAQLPKNDAHALSLFFDFGGSPVGANVKISDIILIKE